MRSLHHGQLSLSGDSRLENPKVPHATKAGALAPLLVSVLCFNLEFGLAVFAHPVVLTFYKGVIVDPLAVVRRTDFTLHGLDSIRQKGASFILLWFQL